MRTGRSEAGARTTRRPSDLTGSIMSSSLFICFSHLRRRRSFILKICWHRPARFPALVCDSLPRAPGCAPRPSSGLSLTHHAVSLWFSSGSVKLPYRPKGGGVCGGSDAELLTGGEEETRGAPEPRSPGAASKWLPNAMNLNSWTIYPLLRETSQEVCFIFIFNGRGSGPHVQKFE